MLLFAEVDFAADNIQVQTTTTSTCGTWAPAAIFHKGSSFFKFAMLHDVVVLHGGVIHWMVRNTHEIVSYNICTMEQGTIRPPVLAASFKGLLCLGSYYSNDGQKLLRLLASKGVKIYVWHQLTNEQWASEPVTIDMERSYCRYTLVSTSVIFCLPSSYGPARGATWWCCTHIRII
jgi:hypothetical protein